MIGRGTDGCGRPSAPPPRFTWGDLVLCITGTTKETTLIRKIGGSSSDRRMGKVVPLPSMLAVYFNHLQGGSTDESRLLVLGVVVQDRRASTRCSAVRCTGSAGLVTGDRDKAGFSGALREPEASNKGVLASEMYLLAHVVL